MTNDTAGGIISKLSREGEQEQKKIKKASKNLKKGIDKPKMMC